MRWLWQCKISIMFLVNQHFSSHCCWKNVGKWLWQHLHVRTFQLGNNVEAFRKGKMVLRWWNKLWCYTRCRKLWKAQMLWKNFWRQQLSTACTTYLLQGRLLPFFYVVSSLCLQGLGWLKSFGASWWSWASAMPATLSTTLSLTGQTHQSPPQCPPTQLTSYPSLQWQSAL